MNTRIIIENSKSYAKIGLVTFHDFNYGSALQCFATQKYLGLKGLIVKLLKESLQELEFWAISLLHGVFFHYVY